MGLRQRAMAAVVLGLALGAGVAPAAHGAPASTSAAACALIGPSTVSVGAPRQAVTYRLGAHCPAGATATWALVRAGTGRLGTLVFTPGRRAAVLTVRDTMPPGVATWRPAGATVEGGAGPPGRALRRPQGAVASRGERAAHRRRRRAAGDGGALPPRPESLCAVAQCRGALSAAHVPDVRVEADAAGPHRRRRAGVGGRPGQLRRRCRLASRRGRHVDDLAVVEFRAPGLTSAKRPRRTQRRGLGPRPALGRGWSGSGQANVASASTTACTSSGVGA